MLEIENLSETPKIRHDSDEIPRIEADELSYKSFFCDFMLANSPVIVKNVKIKTEVSEHWFSCEKFDLKQIQLDDSHEVPIANCSKQYFDSHEKSKMKLKDFIEYWDGRNSNNDSELLYLKDFHLKQEKPDLDFYKVPSYFASDWLNEYLIDKGLDDYRFVYIGPKNSWTPFHSDVFGSFSWSSNIYGRKQWFILPPGEENKLRDQLGRLPFSISKESLQSNNVKFHEIIQQNNETIFVPSKWFHQVKNIDDAVSINHNWFNGCNVNFIAESLLNHHKEVEKEIEDCRDMEKFEEHCQVMLKSSFGMNFWDFVEILEHIGEKRVKYLKENEEFKVFDEHTFGENHLIFDLKSILRTLEKMKKEESVRKFEELVMKIKIIENKIKEIL